MPFEIETEADLGKFDSQRPDPKPRGAPRILSVADLLALQVPPPSMLVESIVPGSGATLLVGAPKSNKTLLSVQIGIAVASGNPVCEYYRVLQAGPVLMVEQDDPAGAASIKDILQRSPVPVEGIPFFLAPRVPFTFGLPFVEWPEEHIRARAQITSRLSTLRTGSMGVAETPIRSYALANSCGSARQQGTRAEGPRLDGLRPKNRCRNGEYRSLGLWVPMFDASNAPRCARHFTGAAAGGRG